MSEQRGIIHVEPILGDKWLMFNPVDRLTPDGQVVAVVDPGGVAITAKMVREWTKEAEAVS